MKLVVGLGNPGISYGQTRHNFGFWAVDALASRTRAKNMGRLWHGDVSKARIAGNDLYILKPRTYMNNSGKAVAAALRELEYSLEDVLIVCDDLALDLGILRFRARGSSGGQKGLQSIINFLQTSEFPRLRLGIGADSELVPRDFVLAQFSPPEQQLALMVSQRASEAIQVWAMHGLTRAMATYNGPILDSNVPDGEIE